MAASRKSERGFARAAVAFLAALAALAAAVAALALLRPGAGAFLRGLPGLRDFAGSPDGPAAESPSGAETGLSLPGLLGDSGSGTGAAGAGYRKVTGPRPFDFPADHGPHPGFRSEWWYFTGNLADGQGRRFGYQLTFFRSALNDAGRGRVSPWAAADAYMAHFAVTDAEAGAFEAHERFSRGALGLAGARAGHGEPFMVWLEDWSAAGDTGFLPLRLRAAQGSIAIDLDLGPGKPMILQGDRGYSRKGPEPGNASLYYSYTRLPTRGRIRSAAGEFAVSGTSWLDREWGSSLLSPGLAGWEWFGLRLADSTDWVFFRLRKTGREAAAEDSFAFDYGLKVDAAGGTRQLDRSDLSARVLSRWTGPGGAAYPSRWRLRIPSESLELEISPILADQALRLSIPYWEGAVRIQAERQGRALDGEGYMELTGY